MADGISVVSAAVVSGELILGLSTGQLIRAGFVQGPQGPAGIPGPKGDTGRRGEDGNSLLSGPGVPLFEDGKAGDWYIDTTRSWLYGPKTNSGGWGSPVKLKPDPAIQKLPNGFKSQQGDPIYPRVFAGAMAGGGGGGTVLVGGAGGATLATIFNHGLPLTSGAPVLAPGTGAVITPAVWTPLAQDSDGDAFIADIYAESSSGAILVELACMRDAAGRTGYSQVYEVRTGTPPTLNFQLVTNASGQLELQSWSPQNISNLRGRILYI